MSEPSSLAQEPGDHAADVGIIDDHVRQIHLKQRIGERRRLQGIRREGAPEFANEIEHAGQAEVGAQVRVEERRSWGGSFLVVTIRLNDPTSAGLAQAGVSRDSFRGRE